MAFSRRKSRASSRKRHFPEDGCALLPEGHIFSRVVASTFEKISFSRGSSRASSRRSHLLEDCRVLLREDDVFSKMAECFFEKVASARGWSCAGSISRVPKMGRFSFLGHFP